MSEQTKPQETAVAEPKKPKPPPREPAGTAPWKITVRHTPLMTKSLVVKANGRKAAWDQFLTELEAKTNETTYKNRPNQLKEAQAWLATARKDGPPPGTEILGEEYHRKRKDAMRVRGTVTADNVGGFEELASLPR